jgi:IS4 transposase
MSLPEAFRSFVEGAPCAVMARLSVEHLVDDQTLSLLFAEHARGQYERQLTLANLVDVMLDVACGIHGSPRSAFQARSDQIAASLSAFYGKLNRTELSISAAVVAHSGEKARAVIRAMRGLDTEPVPGFASYVLDGNMLAGSEHRLKPLRKTRAAALPGKLLALYECATGVVVKTVLWEDAHSQERALLPELTIEAGIHLMADRNFCVCGFMQRIQQSRSWFTIRHHRSSFPLESVEPVGKARRCGRCETGTVSEQAIRVAGAEGRGFLWRKITLHLDTPTRDGETEIVLIANLPRRVKAPTIARAYRRRWTIENHFQRLTDWLHCELPTLGYPRAALFAFAMSLVAGNALAMLIGALRAVHGATLADNLSYAALADEIAGTQRGMMLALPPRRWTFARDQTPQQIGRLLKHVAQHANLKRLHKTKRGPKKPRRNPNCKNIRHLSTHRILLQKAENTC